MKMLFIPTLEDLLRCDLSVTDVTNKTLPALLERRIDSVSFLAPHRLVTVVILISH